MGKDPAYGDLPAFGGSEELSWRYREQRRIEEQVRGEIEIIVEADGTVTFKGLPYRDFSSLMVAASLNFYDGDDKPGSSERELAWLEASLEMGGEPRWSGQRDILILNAHEDRRWRAQMRGIMEAIEAVKSDALTLHNKGYSKWETRYWRWTAPIRELRFKAWKVSNAVRQFMRKTKVDD